MPLAYAKETASATLQNANTRDEIIRALKAINKGSWDTGRSIIASTRDPLAAKLYEWLEFSRRSEVRNYSALAQFIRNNPDWPGRSALLKKAEEDLPPSLNNAEVLAWFADYPPKTAQGLDRYLTALIGSGQQAKAKTFLTGWWGETTMSRDAQREIFRKYQSMLTRQAHINRFDSMLYKGAYSNARAIAEVLGEGYPQLAEARIALAGESQNVETYINAVPGKLQNDAGLLYERLRWRRRAGLDMGAVEILHKMPPANKILNLEDWWRERHILIRRMLENKRYKSAYLLAAQHQQKQGLAFAQAEWLAGWLALRFMDNPKEAYGRFSNLYRNVNSPMSKSRAAYWAGRAAETYKDKTVSAQSYEIAALFPTVFYGQLAAEKVGKSGQLPAGAPPSLSGSDKQGFDRRELVQAANLLHKAGMTRDANRFLHALVEAEKSPKAYRFAAELAADMGQIDTALKISKDATQEGMFLTAQAYPLITNRLQGINLEWALVHGIIRQESQFDFEAQSPAGALGLMQLMPATAKETARKIGLSHTTGQLVSDPNHNIRLGSEYLGRLIQRYGGSYPLAISAYNAGPGRTDKWLEIFGDPRTGEVDLIDWIELIPIYETRNYVQRVLEATHIYRLRLKGQQAASKSALHVAYK